MHNKLVVFKGKNIRRTLYQNKWCFVVADIIEALTDNRNKAAQEIKFILGKHGFALAGLEEWISHRVSERGPRAGAEDRARKEFPLFLMLKAQKLTRA